MERSPQFARKTRQALFLEEMKEMVPWDQLLLLLNPICRSSKRRRVSELERMLRIYFVQHWFNLSDAAVEEALYDVPVMRSFVGIDLEREAVPDASTICKFHRRVDKHQIGNELLRTVHCSLRRHGAQLLWPSQW